MTGLAPTIRAALFDAIDAQKLALGYSINTFTLEEQAKKRHLLEDLETPVVTLIAAAFDQRPFARKPTAAIAPRQSDIPVYVFLQQRLDKPEDLSESDPLAFLYEELMDTAARLELAGFTWRSNESPKRPDGLPYDYDKLQEHSTYEAMFLANYTHLPN